MFLSNSPVTTCPCFRYARPISRQAAFDGDMDEVKKWLDQGYSADSADGRNHSAISEASCQGHDALVAFLLGLGADPNVVADTGRSPLYRAAFNGHLATVRLVPLLMARNGAKPLY